MARGTGPQQAEQTPAPARSKPWVCPAWELDERSLEAVVDWARSQDWPDGTELKDPSSMHITAFYARDGYGNDELQQWLAAQTFEPASARLKDLACFDPGDRDARVPLVARLDAPALEREAKRISDEAERRFGIQVLRHEDGYQPHITIAMLPSLPDPVPAAPDLTLRTGPLVELHQRKDQRVSG